MPGLHVFMTADAVGGVWTYAHDLAAEFSRRGLKTTLAVVGPSPKPEQKRAAETIPGVCVLETGLPLDWLAERPEALTEASRRLAALAAESGADLIHLNSPALAAGAPFQAPVVGVCHSCLATWWDAVRGGALPDDFVWRTERLIAGYQACDLLVAPSYAFMQAMAARYGLLPRVVRNGRAVTARVGRRAEKRPFAFASGRFWDEAKNVRALDAAAMRMQQGRIYAAGPLAHEHAAAPPLTTVVGLGSLPPAAVSAMAAACSPFTASWLPSTRPCKGRPHEGRLFLPFPRLLLEPRQRPFPARRAA